MLQVPKSALKSRWPYQLLLIYLAVYMDNKFSDQVYNKKPLLLTTDLDIIISVSLTVTSMYPS